MHGDQMIKNNNEFISKLWDCNVLSNRVDYGLDCHKGVKDEKNDLMPLFIKLENNNHLLYNKEIHKNG